MKHNQILLTVFVLLASLFFWNGAAIMTGKRGPGPDWNIQVGLNQPTGDTSESARRTIFGSLPSTGHLLWGSSFNEDVAEIKISGSGVGFGQASVDWTEDKANSGPGSLVLKSWVANKTASINKLTGALGRTKIGTSIWVYPEIDTVGNAYQDLVLNLEMNFMNMGNDIYIVAQIDIQRNLAGAHNLYYWNGAWVNTGIAIPDIFVKSADAWPYTYWRYLKLVVDVSQDTPRYDYLEIDGARLDLSSFIPAYTRPSVINRSFIFSYLLFRSSENSEKILYADDWSITDNEP